MSREMSPDMARMRKDHALSDAARAAEAEAQRAAEEAANEKPVELTPFVEYKDLPVEGATNEVLLTETPAEMRNRIQMEEDKRAIEAHRKKLKGMN